MDFVTPEGAEKAIADVNIIPYSVFSFVCLSVGLNKAVNTVHNDENNSP